MVSIPQFNQTINELEKQIGKGKDAKDAEVKENEGSDHDKQDVPEVLNENPDLQVEKLQKKPIKVSKASLEQLLKEKSKSKNRKRSPSLLREEKPIKKIKESYTFLD